MNLYKRKHNKIVVFTSWYLILISLLLIKFIHRTDKIDCQQSCTTKQVLLQYATNEGFLLLKLTLGPYYKSKLELKSNSSEILSSNCKFTCVHVFTFCAESQT